MAESREFGVIVVGGGPAGVTVALHARELGVSVALVERARMILERFGQRLRDEGGIG